MKIFQKRMKTFLLALVCACALAYPASGQNPPGAYSAPSAASSSLAPNTPGIPSSNGAGAFYAANYGVKADGYSVSDASTVITTPNVSCPNSDCTFLTTAKVGQRIWVTTTCTGTSSTPLPLGGTGLTATILSITDNNHLVASVNAAASVTGTGCLVYGDIDQSSAALSTDPWQSVMNAVSAQLLVGPAALFLPCGLSIVEAPVNFSTETVHFPVTIKGCGQPSSLFAPSPNFTKGAATTMFLNGLTLNNSQGQIIADDLEVWGSGIAGAGNCPSPSITAVNIGANWYARNVIVNAWCGGTLLQGISFSGFRCDNCQTDFASGFTWNTFGQPSTCIACFGGDAGNGLKLTGNGIANSISSTWQGAGSCGNAVDFSTATVVFNSYGDYISNGINFGSVAAKMNAFGTRIDNLNCSSSHGGIDFGSSAATVNLLNGSKVSALGTTTLTFSGTGTVVTDQTSQFVAGTTGVAPTTVTFSGAPVFTGVGAGTATANTTVFLQPPNSTSNLFTNTTATTVLFTVPFTGTLSNMLCSATTGGANASSGVVTIRTAPLSTGTFAASALTATFGTGTTANDVTHTAAVTAGQAAQIQVTTQVAETLAGVTCSVLLHL